MPEVGDVIKSLGWVLDIENLDGSMTIWGDAIMIKMLCFQDPGMGMCWAETREVEESDICNEEEREKYFIRANKDIFKSIDDMMECLDLVAEQL